MCFACLHFSISGVLELVWMRVRGELRDLSEIFLPVRSLFLSFFFTEGPLSEQALLALIKLVEMTQSSTPAESQG